MGTRAGAVAARARSYEIKADAAEKREQTAAYIADMAGDLAGIALRNGLETLAYVLDMARIEALNAIDPEKDKR